MPKLLFISPMVPSFDVNETSDFLKNAIGFDIRILDSDYAICEKDGMTIHLLPAGENIGQMEFYVEVDNVDEVWEQMKPHVTNLKHKQPFDRPYKMREIHVELPKTNCLMFIGQCI